MRKFALRSGGVDIDGKLVTGKPAPQVSDLIEGGIFLVKLEIVKLKR